MNRSSNRLASASTPSHAREHGGAVVMELRELGVDQDQLVDFSVSCNPYGPCRELVAAVRDAPIDRYPDPSALRAREAIATSLERDPGEIALGNGASELLWSLAQIFVRPGTRVLVVEPTFCEFRTAAERSGGRIYEWRAHAERDFRIEVDEIAIHARSCEAELIYLCTPNTPTGAAVPASHVARLALSNPELTIVLDQSFLALSLHSADLQLEFPANVVCVRSLTKEHAIAGLRVGYVVATSGLLARLEDARASWTTSAPAQAAAIAACHTRDFVEQSCRRLLADLAALACDLRALGLSPVPSAACFLLVRVGDARALRQRILTRHRILVRDCTSFGLPEHIRIAARPEADRARLLEALKQELAP